MTNLSGSLTPFSLAPADAAGFAWSQRAVAEHHYLRKAVDPRSRPFAYVLRFQDEPAGCLVFGRTQSTCCYQGGLTYGGAGDVRDGRAAFDRWEVLNLARVWIDPRAQAGGEWCLPTVAPGFVDRRGVWRPSLASSLVRAALARVGFDYLTANPPCFIDEPYEIRAVLSYCDTWLHRGTIYRAAGFALARSNASGVETWWTGGVAPLTGDQHAAVRERSLADPRAQRVRERRKGVAA